MRVVFMGTPDFAACSLQRLIDANYDIAGVFTQPDRPRGRGMSVSFSPVKELAVKNGLPVYQPERLRGGEALEILRALAPDVIAVVAYGRLIPDDILALPRYGCINVHASLLPAWRGSAPIQRAVLSGDRVTGVSTMYMASELDAGDVLLTRETQIGEFETSGELFDRLMVMGAELLDETLAAIGAGTAVRRPQDASKATYAPRLDKSMCPIDFSKTPREVVKWIYGLQPWPVATAEIDGETLRVFAAEYTDTRTEKAPGSVVGAGKRGIEIACAGGGTVLLTEVQATGKKRMRAADYLLGHPIKAEG